MMQDKNRRCRGWPGLLGVGLRLVLLMRIDVVSSMERSSSRKDPNLGRSRVSVRLSWNHRTSTVFVRVGRVPRQQLLDLYGVLNQQGYWELEQVLASFIRNK